MSFIPPMLSARLEDPDRLADRRYVAEPKLDGQRAQVHVRNGRTARCYSRSGRDLLGHPGMAWLHALAWPFASVVLDGELVAGDGHEGVHSVLAERNRADADLAFVAFDVLMTAGQNVMREPWSDRRKRLDDLCEGRQLERIAVVPVTDDARALWDVWVGRGGEGIVLKDRRSIYRPGIRCATWLKLKPQFTLDVVIPGGSATPIPWGDWGLAVVLRVRYRDPRTADKREIEQALRVPRDRPFELKMGAPASVVCWGIMPSGLLRHPVFLGWKD